MSDKLEAALHDGSGADANELKFQVVFKATGVVHDADGNVVENTTHEDVQIVTAAQLAEMGLEAPPSKEQ